ncbi:hypothetical protein [Methylocella sp.]|uniref:hypothetical protein n=1 Tax=Methylocella sp. TaxID=1978226 RepID=UPI003782EE69
MRSNKTRLFALLLASCAFAGPAAAAHQGTPHHTSEHRAYCQTRYKSCQRGCKTSEGGQHCTRCRINYKQCISH